MSEYGKEVKIRFKDTVLAIVWVPGTPKMTELEWELKALEILDRATQIRLSLTRSRAENRSER